MALPPLVHYDTVAEYRAHYERIYCRGTIMTFDGIRVHFSPTNFGHMFYESSARNGCKDIFSLVRARRIDWIKLTLEHPKASLFDGWNKGVDKYDSSRRVAVVYEDFVVIIELKLKSEGAFKAKFVTCYQADNSINKIRQSPKWSQERCFQTLNRKGSKQISR